jgi:hypothetical protein
MVRSEYDELFEGDVVEVHVVYKTDSLDDLVKDYDSGLRDLEDLIDDYASQKARDKKVTSKQVKIPRCPGSGDLGKTDRRDKHYS